MTGKTIKEIIDTYLRNEVPDSVKDSFEKWMLESDRFQEKEDALKEIWDTFDPYEEGHFSPLHSAETELTEAERIGHRHSAFPKRRKSLMIWLSSAAAVFFAILSVVQFILTSDSRQVVCLASSDGAKASFSLPDGSEVWLNRDSRLYYSGGLSGRKRTVRLEGEGFFDVSSQPDRPFIVQAADIEISVLGTEFTVSAYGRDSVKAYLQEGCIAVDGPGLKESIVLNPDSMLSYDRQGTSYRKSRVKASNHTSWINEKLVFRDTSLLDIIETLCHWYHADITCPDVTFAKNTRLSLTVRQEPVCEILSAIGNLAPISYSTDSAGTITIFQTKN